MAAFVVTVVSVGAVRLARYCQYEEEEHEIYVEEWRGKERI